MTSSQHEAELHSVLITMTYIAKHTVIRTGVLPDNILQTIYGLREYSEAVACEPRV